MTHSDDLEQKDQATAQKDQATAQKDQATAVAAPVSPPLPAQREVGGREGPEPTRFGDWELRGRCIDF